MTDSAIPELIGQGVSAVWSPLLDTFNRRINYIRISITDRCNLECNYCKPRNVIKMLPKEEVLTLEEVERLVRIASRLGVTKVRFTGGEPLQKKGLADLLHRVKRIPGIEKMGITTNGVLLADKYRELSDAGVRHFNVSLDTFDRNMFRELTGVDALDRVMDGIHTIMTDARSRLKLNVVIVKGVNEAEIDSFVRFAIEYGIEIRFIEQMGVKDTGTRFESYLDGSWIRDRIQEEFELRKLERKPMDGPAILYSVEDSGVKIGIIPGNSGEICAACNRLRITASGALKNCLFNNRGADLIGPLRTGLSDEEIARIFHHTLRTKKFSKNRMDSHDSVSSDKICGMWKIGG